MAKDYKDESGARIMPLGEMRDFEVAEGYPDIRGWRVDAADGTHVGTVHELLVDADTMRTRYLDVRLTPDIAATPHDRDVLVPIGAARLEDADKRVVVPLNADRVGLLPPYAHGQLTRAYEYEVRRHYTLGDAAASAAAAAAGANPPARDFYEGETYDDRRFFAAGRPAADAAPRAQPGTEGEVRVPVSPADSVSLKRGVGGHDEIIIRRPAGPDAGRTP